MPMTSRERWRACLDGRRPDRVPTDFWGTEEVLERLRKDLGVQSDIEIFDRLGIDRPFGVGARRKVNHHPADPEADIWGIRYRRVDYGSGSYNEGVTQPLAGAETPSDIKSFQWPDPADCTVDHIPGELARAEGRWVSAGGYEPFLLYGRMRGLEKSFEDLMERPELAEAILVRIFEYHYAVNRKVFEAGAGRIDMTCVAEDLGSQESLLMSPALYRKFLKERQRAMIQLAKKFGMRVLYHSDGAVRPLIPDLIEIGIDILNPLQWRCPGMELDGLARDFGGAIAFHGGVDNQKTLPFGTPADVREEVRRNLSIFRGRRYILAPCHNIQPVTPTENILALYAAAGEFGGMS
ncbi:MAG: uroporphyrinogen decarboxylase family protein [Planctomycetota bacterium]